MLLRSDLHPSIRPDKITTISPSLYTRLVECVDAAKTKQAKERLLAAVSFLTLEDLRRTQETEKTLQALIHPPLWKWIL